MKKILIIVNNLGVGGAERLVVDDINEMIHRGIDVTLLTLKAESDKTLSHQCSISPAKWFVVSFGSLLNIFSWMKVIRVIRDTRADLIVTHLWFANTVGRVSAKILGFKNIVAFEQNVYDSVKTPKMFFIDRLIQNWCLRIIAVSEIVKKSLLKHGIKENRIEVIYNSVNTEKYKNISGQYDFTVKNEDFKFLYVGRLIKQKGVDILISALAKTSGAYLYIAGQGPESDYLHGKVKEFNLENRVVFLGVVKDVPLLMKSCDCFVYPSRHDGFSLVLLEALASGLPSITSDFESNLELVDDGISGLIFKVDNIDELADKMNMIKTDVDLRKRLRQNAVSRAGDFSIQKHVSSIERLIIERK
ncbi:MAG: glycosyltransferase family 4 protein [bacterium]